MNKHLVTIVAFLVVLCAGLVNSTNLAIPYPLPVCTGDDCIWNTVFLNADVLKIITITADVNLGAIVDTNLLDLIIKAQLLGISVFAKVNTGHTNRSLLDVKADIDIFVNLYHIDGILFDEIPHECSCSDYFSDLYAYVKVKLGGLVVLNVGVNIPECFGLFADVLVVFDSTFANYKRYVPNPWYANYPPSTFWHIVHNCPATQKRSALMRSKKNRASFIYLDADVDIGTPSGDLLSIDLTLVARLLRLLFLDLDLNINL
jgi:hypothetical protein